MKIAINNSGGMSMIRAVLKTFVLGIVFGLGFSLVLGVGVFAYKTHLFDRILNRVWSSENSVQAMDIVPFDEKDIPANPFMNLKPFQKPPIPSGYSIHNVKDTNELWSALSAVNKNSGNSAILLSDGVYALEKTINIDVENVMLMSNSSDPRSVVLKGRGCGRLGRLKI